MPDTIVILQVGDSSPWTVSAACTNTNRIICIGGGGGGRSGGTAAGSGGGAGVSDGATVNGGAGSTWPQHI